MLATSVKTVFSILLASMPYKNNKTNKYFLNKEHINLNNLKARIWARLTTVLMHLLMWDPVFVATTEPPVSVDGHDPGERRK